MDIFARCLFFDKPHGLAKTLQDSWKNIPRHYTLLSNKISLWRHFQTKNNGSRDLMKCNWKFLIIPVIKQSGRQAKTIILLQMFRYQTRKYICINKTAKSSMHMISCKYRDNPLSTPHGIVLSTFISFPNIKMVDSTIDFMMKWTRFYSGTIHSLKLNLDF